MEDATPNLQTGSFAPPVFHGAYISTGKHTGFYTMRLVNSGGGHYSDNYSRVLGRGWATSYAKYQRFVEVSNRVRMTMPDDEFDLNEWGAGGSQDWSVTRYHEWQVKLGQGTMPFGKHRDAALADLPSEYRTWLLSEARTKVATMTKFPARSWQLVVDALVPFEPADKIVHQADLDRKAAIRSEREKAEAASEFFGTEGEKFADVIATIDLIRFFDGAFGRTTMIKAHTDAKNVLIYFTTGGWEGDEGDRVSIRGRVKRHETREGVKQTVLTRCKIKKAGL